ncbi:carboxypeptidase y [Anaeramoeba ignava]|uniref:Carboxypeptidase y n=1 Tax=Anaeramoeba ignava TaxID=1746090 RepID=A0A9Q0LFY5_ANAIG|nr:carboxypeptidase y [Anaeramoeba ignava]
MKSISLFLFLFLFYFAFSHPKVIINNISRSDIYNETFTTISGQECYTGYIEVNETMGAELFFIFFKSQQGMSQPVALWLQGGPGCSSEYGAFIENGPILIQKDYSFIQNPYSWTNYFNMLYIDSPVGTGFSYVDNSAGYVNNEDALAEDLFNGLLVFFDKFFDYYNNDFYVTGESYSGKYVPSLAYKIMSSNSDINLKGIVIGDGLVDPLPQVLSYSQFAYSLSFFDPIKLAQLQTLEQQCAAYIQSEQWEEAGNTFSQIDDFICAHSPVNCYDIRGHSDQGSELSKWLNEQSTQSNLGVENITWVSCSPDIWNNFTQDLTKSVKSKIEALLNNNYKVLLYNGQFDYIINLVGVYEWMKDINWSGIDNFLNTTRNVWQVDSQIAGYGKNYENLWFFMFHNTGHFVMIKLKMFWICFTDF